MMPPPLVLFCTAAFAPWLLTAAWMCEVRRLGTVPDGRIE
jgi:hypothetical protein